MRIQRRSVWILVVLTIVVVTSACTGGSLAQSNESARPIGEPLPRHGVHGVSSVAFSPDGKTLASAEDTTVKLWDVATRRPIGELLGDGIGDASGVAFSPDGKMLASGVGETVRLWNITTHQPIGEPLRAHNSEAKEAEWVLTVAFSPDGKTLAAGI